MYSSHKPEGTRRAPVDISSDSCVDLSALPVTVSREAAKNISWLDIWLTSCIRARILRKPKHNATH